MRTFLTRCLVAIGAMVVITCEPVQAQPSRLNLSACELFAELDLYPSGITAPGRIADYIRFSVQQIYDRSKSDRDDEVRNASFALLKAALTSKDYGERFSGPERHLAQLRRDIQDGMIAMSQVCHVRAPGRTITPEELAEQTRRAREQAGRPGAKCETKTYGGGAAITVCE